MGAITLLAKFVVPVKKAKTVPSIFFGVIFAKRARVGRVFMAKLATPKTVSVSRMNTISLTPIIVFHLLANAYYENEEIIEHIVDQYITVLTSTSFNYAS